jgi:SNF2 family DNA or RNA helicase
VTTELYPFQRATVDKILNAPLRRHFVCMDTGLGKTATSLTAAREMGAKRVLIVAPAVTRIGWVRELDTWWPGHPPVSVISLGRAREKGMSKPALARKEAAYTSDIQIVSYDLADQVDTEPWDLIILDEVHRTKSPSTKQTIAVRTITRANPAAAMILLSATPMADKPTDIWSQLDLAWPERFGTIDKNGKGCWKFSNHYANRELRTWPGGQAWHHFGINELNVEELQQRLAAVSTRVTKKEVAAFLPPLITQTLRIPRGKGSFKLKGTDEKAIISALMKIGEEKIAPTLDWLEDTLASAKKVVVFTYGIELAETIAERAAKLKGAPPVFCITGSVLPDKRQGIVDQFKAADRALCVASMKSAGIGINGLDCATDVLFAELYYRPETLSQALGRFNRLSSKEPTTISLLVLEGTLDEALAVKLQNKLAAINAAIKAGQAEEGLDQALSAESPEAEADFLYQLQQYAENSVDSYEYIE